MPLFVIGALMVKYTTYIFIDLPQVWWPDCLYSRSHLGTGLCQQRRMMYKIPDNRRNTIEIVSEYDQEIPQSQTADNPVAPRGRAAQPSRDTRKTI